MPLDTGDLAHRRIPHTEDQIAGLRPAKVVLSSGGHVGSALRAARESLGLVEDDIAQVTRVRAAYIAAIEAFDFDALPSRPFVVGYVRAYAQALGVDAEAVVARFRAEAPKVDGKLGEPGGVRYDAFASIRWLMVIGAVVAGAVVIWNVTRRAELRTAQPVAASSRPARSARPSQGPAQIGAPLPTPPEATTPPVYETPGLEAAKPPAPGSAAGAAAAKTGSGGLTDGQPGTAGVAFTPAGTVYGAGGSEPAIVLQARKSTVLVVRGAAGAVYFARLLAPGEAWRAPALAGLTVDVGEPASVEVFVAGVSHGRLLQPQTALARLGDS